MKTLRTLILMMLILQCTAYAYDGSDNSDRLSNGSSSVFSPGYINAAKQKTEAVISQMDPKKSFMERLVDNIKAGVADNVDDAADTKVTAEVKMKKSSAPVGSGNTTINQAGLVDSVNYNINIGSGNAQQYLDRATNKVYNTMGSGRVLESEEINGKRYVYVGFDSYGYSYSSLMSVISNTTADDNIILRGGLDKNGNSIQYAGGYVSKRVSILGGFDENGNRQWNSSTGAFNNESSVQWLSLSNITNSLIDGIKFRDTLELDNSAVNIYNCTFLGSRGLRVGGIYGTPSVMDVNISNNTFSGNLYGIIVSSTNKYNISISRNNFLSSCKETVNANGSSHTNINLSYNNFGGTVELGGNGQVIYSDHNNFFNNVTSITTAWSGSKTYYSTNDYFQYGGSFSGPGINIQNKSSSAYNIPLQGFVSQKIATTVPTTTSIGQQNPLNTIPSSALANTKSGFDYLKYLGIADPIAMGNDIKNKLLNKNGNKDINIASSNSADALAVKISNNDQSNLPILTPGDNADAVVRLESILNNPSEDQKFIIETILSLLKGISEIEEEAGKSAELTKAENDLLQMAAAVLLAQGIPDLLKEGDVENMKGMFKDLGASKDKVLLNYKDSIKPYYNNIAKEIAANIAVLEIKGIVNKKLTEEELRKMEPREIDRILENIRKSNDKSFELEYILQQDSKYRKEYLEPSKKLMEDHMKDVLGVFAKKISEALEEKR